MRTVKRFSEDLLQAANQLQTNLQLTLQKANEKDNLALHYINVNAYTHKNVICGWYQKLTSTAAVLYFMSSVLLRYKKNKKEGAAH